MSPPDGARLPGGLGVWRARWLLLVGGGGRSGPCGVRADQPALHRLAAEAAEAAGTPPPRVRLHGEPVVTAHAGRKPCVHIGLPLAHTLSEAELRALVAHHLAPLGFARPRLVGRLHRAWQEARRQTVDRVERGERATGRQAMLLGGAARFADKVDRHADAVPVPMLGLPRTAMMFARAETVSLEFTRYLATVVRVALDRGYAVIDLHEGWRRLLRLGGIGETGWGVDVADELVARHPRLARAITALGTERVELDHPQGTVELAPLALRVQRRLAREVIGPASAARGRSGAESAVKRSEPGGKADWRTLDEVPPDVWRQRAVAQAGQLTADVALLLGRQPTDLAEVVAVLTTRTRELAARNGVDAAGATPAPALLAVFEGALLARGWRRADPVLPGVLVSPGGETVDGRELDAAALTKLVGGAD